jgi:hypothetical protein
MRITNADFGRVLARRLPLFGRPSGREENEVKTRLDTPLLAGIGVIAIGLAALAGYEIWYGQHAKVSTGVPAPITKQPDNPAPPEAVFTADQNDPAGFDEIPWGTPRSDRRFHFFSSEENNWSTVDGGAEALVVAKVVGPPVNWPSYDNLQLSGEYSGAYRVRFPEGISMTAKDTSTFYGFYEDKFAFAFQFVGDPSDENGDANALAAIQSKYLQLKAVTSDSWGESQSLPSYLIEFTGGKSGYLFRRGNTNTRVYLFGQDLVYIPNSYLLAIRQRWQSDYEKAATAAVEQQRRDEEEQRKAATKAVQ